MYLLESKINLLCLSKKDGSCNLEQKQRIDYKKVAPEAYQAMVKLQNYVDSITELPKSLLELVRMRTSQINGCAYCLDMHSIDARAEGESEQRLYVLDAWREAPFYSDVERAALAWTEAITLVADSRVPDEVYQEARKHFSEKQLVDLTIAIIAIKSWNRLSISMRGQAGHYKRIESLRPVLQRQEK
jgi:AhpD family alkylhydroperoxidase